jgi:hypothetical protein
MMGGSMEKMLLVLLWHISSDPRWGMHLMRNVSGPM